MKITGKEFKEWHDTAWPEGFIWDDETLLLDGRELYSGPNSSIVLADDEVFTVPDWYIFPENLDGDGIKVITSLKRWQKKKSTLTLAIEVPKEREKEIRAFLNELRIKIVN